MTDIVPCKAGLNLQIIVYGGGMLPVEIGDTLCQRIKLMTMMGSYEKDVFKDDRDGLGNLTIVKQKKYELHQGVFSAFPETEEHAMGDLFESHPVKPGLWRYRARVDDIISFTTAEKLDRSTMETTI
ncbi:hypothetical protein LQW54_008886 [Pestalotiopsis sp. IQ-011]